MRKDPYMLDGHKLLWHLDRVNSWLKGERIPPIHIDLGLATGCNIRCIFCYGKFMREEKNNYLLPKDAFIRLIRDAKEIGVRSIAIIGEGEPTLNPALYDGAVESSKVGLDIALATNGVLLDKNRILELLSSLTWLRFNLSASSPSSYRFIHGAEEEVFNRVIKNIEMCVDLKHKHNLPVTLGVQMVVLMENKDDIIPLVKLSSNLGVDYVVIKPCSDTPDGKLNSPLEKYDALLPIFREAESFSNDNFVVSVKWSRFEEKGKKNYDVCYGTPFIIFISSKGDVYPCCHMVFWPNDRFNMGNIVSSSIKDIINSDRYWEVHKKVEKIDVHKECEIHCRTHYINQFLWMLKNPPQHINFV